MSSNIKAEPQDFPLRGPDYEVSKMPIVKTEPNDLLESHPTRIPTEHSTRLGNSYSQSSSTYGINFPINGNPSPVPRNPQNRPLPSALKYAKIQPAIAPKPVLPKPTTFSSIPAIKDKSVQMHTSASDSSVNLNINTSRRWVLPPRPRPGRKPTTGAEDEIKKQKGTKSVSIANSNSNSNSTPPDLVSDIKTTGTTPKKRAKLSKKDDLVKQEPITMLVSCSSPANLEHSKLGTIIEDKKIMDNSIPPPPVAKTDSRTEINELKVSYLTKLKEQELIRNYIEVITNQIKELSFVQNGVISVDTLKTAPTNSLRIRKNNGGPPANSIINTNTGVGANNGSGSSSSSSNGTSTSSGSRSSYDQLESINNLNDLNKFLAYLTKSSNIIHSVTKKKSSEDADTAVNNQIHHFLDIRAKFKLMKLEEAKKADNLKAEWKRSIQKIGIEKSQPDPKPSAILSSPSIANPQTSFIFTNDLLKMKGSNLFSEDHDFMIDMIDDDYAQGISHDMAMDEEDILKAAQIDPNGLEIMEELNLGNVKIYDKNETTTAAPRLIKKKLKLNCGFCTNDTPCLCLDADLDLM